MASKMGALADAVAAVLNQDPPPVALGVAAASTRRASWTSVQLETLKVAVVPGPADYQRITRKELTPVFATDLVFAKRVKPEVNAEVDAVAELAEATAEYFAATYDAALLTVGAGQARLAKPPEFVGPDEAAIESKLLTDNRTAMLVLRLTWWL